MTLADPKFFKPWRKRLGYTHAQAAQALGIQEDEYRALEGSGRIPAAQITVCIASLAVTLTVPFWPVSQLSMGLAAAGLLGLAYWAAKTCR